MTADEAVERIIALRELTKETGCITRRTQNELLASLPGDVLAEVAVKLNQYREGHERNERTRQY
jgi:hypothetical protein